MTMARAFQTREMDFLLDFFGLLRTANGTGDYREVERRIAPDAVLLVQEGEMEGREAVLNHLKSMQNERHRLDIVAPKGGLVTVLVSPVARDGARAGRGREQVYRIQNDRLVELIDLGRTPQQVYRPESQPS